MRPEGLSRYAWNKYRKTFERGCEFWTSEDGMLAALVIMPSEDWEDVFKREFSHRLSNQEFKPERIKLQFAYEEWTGREYFDGPNSNRSGKVWRTGDEKTPFPVLVYDLYDAQPHDPQP